MRLITSKKDKDAYKDERFRAFYPYLVFIVFGYGVVEILISMNGRSLDSGAITIGSIGCGVILGSFFYLFFNVSHILISILLWVIGSGVVISLTNTKLASSEGVTIEYKIQKKDKKVVRNRVQEYFLLTYNGVSTEYGIEKQFYSDYEVGDSLYLNTKVGFFGFPVIGKIDDTFQHLDQNQLEGFSETNHYE